MNATCRKLLVQMVISVMAGDKKTAWHLYDLYLKEQRLHAPVREFIQAKEREEGVA